VTAILAVGMVLVIVAREIDLSVGAMAGLLGGVPALASVNAGWPLGPAFAAGLAPGAPLGLAPGGLGGRLRGPALLVTPGGMLVFQGVLLGATGGISVSPGRAFLFVGQAYVGKTAGWILAALLAGSLVAAGLRARGPARARRLALAAVAAAFTAVMNAYEG